MAGVHLCVFFLPCWISDIRNIGISIRFPSIQTVRGMKLTLFSWSHVATQSRFQPAGRAGLRFSAKIISEASRRQGSKGSNADHAKRTLPL